DCPHATSIQFTLLFTQSAITTVCPEFSAFCMISEASCSAIAVELQVGTPISSDPLLTVLIVTQLSLLSSLSLIAVLYVANAVLFILILSAKSLDKFIATDCSFAS